MANFLNIKRSAKMFNIICAKISANILKQRILKGKSQKEFAEYMGVTQGMVSKWESGDYNFTIRSISEIFEKLDLDLDFDVKPRTGNNVIRYEFFFDTPEKNTDISKISEMAG